MSREDGVVRKLSSDECWDLLRSNRFGRLAYRLRGRTRIAPINYTVVDDRLVFRTAEGSKFYALKVEDSAVFEIDFVAEDSAWSVIAHGKVHEITDDPDVDAAMADLRSWVPTKKNHTFAMDVDKVRGRAFVIDRDHSDGT